MEIDRRMEGLMQTYWEKGGTDLLLDSSVLSSLFPFTSWSQRGKGNTLAELVGTADALISPRRIFVSEADCLAEEFLQDVGEFWPPDTDVDELNLNLGKQQGVRERKIKVWCIAHVHSHICICMC